jgi:diguanylate cyclase (GGDEF)-like protein
MVDIDHFKRINDRYGHEAGDLVLKEIAHKIQETLREVDLPARYGGEEFAVLLPHTSKRDAMIVAERICSLVRKATITLGNDTVKLSASVGVSGNIDVTSGIPEDLVKAADFALYEAKRMGRDRAVLFDEKTSLPPTAG